MKQTFILLAGYPGTGKSYLAKMLIEQCGTFRLCSPDEFKEYFWDAYGFDTEAEKNHLIEMSWQKYYQALSALFAEGYSVISDYPFSEKQKTTLSMLEDTFHVQILTIRLVGDLSVLYERQRSRDLQNSRHLGHIVKKYHKGQAIHHKEADNLLNQSEFHKRCTTRGYGEFSLGKLIELDVTDFTKVDYPKLMREIQAFVD